jgi:hypothetical protein
MFFEDVTEEKKLYEDIQFKRRVAFIDDDNLIDIKVEPFSRSSNQSYVDDKSFQVNIQNDFASVASQTRSKKSKEVTFTKKTVRSNKI